VWQKVRALILLLVLLGVGAHTWMDKITTRSWKQTLWVGVFPINADGSPAARQYIAGLTPAEFEGIETFFEREAHRFGVRLEHPVHVELYPEVSEQPPALDRDAGRLSVAWWSLKMRWYAAHAGKASGHATPRIRIFVLYHDPSTLQVVPDSRGLEKGLIGVVQAFAESSAAGGNNIVIAHELLHTLGATDKYELNTGVPLYPIGFADPDRRPLYPQTRAEIMAGRRAVSTQEVEMPQSLRDVVVGPGTATEILWIRK
jgi:hypothetical protein